jgi:hypothetical protein
MTNKELHLLTHPDEWPHEGFPLLNRCGGDVITITRTLALLWKIIFAACGQAII